MTLERKLAAIREGAAERIPAETRAIMHKATEDLQNSGILDGVIQPGSALPDFALTNTTGATIAAGQLLQQGSLVLTVYRGLW
jgi:hypothetical protein